jgi:hypothetical protein
MFEICMYVPYFKLYRYEALNAILLRTLIHYGSNMSTLHYKNLHHASQSPGQDFNPELQEY